VDTSTDDDRFVTAAMMYRGSRDFFLAYELLATFLRSIAQARTQQPAPVQSQATCAALALELALKARVVLDGGDPPDKGRAGHDSVLLFGRLKPAARVDVASFLLLDGQPATVEGLVAVLKKFEGTFENWRYMHEHDEVAFHEGQMVAVLHAVYRSIVRIRPDFGSAYGP
jgi:hypothetical protein